MVTETGNSAEIGKEFSKVDDAARLLHGLIKVAVDSAVIGAANEQLTVLMSEVNTADKNAASLLEAEISRYFQSHLNAPLDLKIDLERDPREKFLDRENVREKIDQLAALALKYSEFETKTEGAATA